MKSYSPTILFQTLRPRRLKLAITVIICAWLLALIGCAGEKPLSTLQPDDTILAFGDSLTFGKGVNPAQAYPAVLQELSGHPVVNAGVSGETTEQGLKRLPGELQTHNPGLVILFEGGNDILQNLPSANTEANLDSMIQHILNHGSQIVLVAVPEKSIFSSSAPWYTALAEKHNLIVQDDIVSKLLKKPSMKSDSVHFNEAGYRALAESIHEMLKDNKVY